MEILGREGVLMTAFLFILAFIILYVLVKLFPPWEDTRAIEEARLKL
jgi:hypothetical protein